MIGSFGLRKWLTLLAVCIAIGIAIMGARGLLRAQPVEGPATAKSEAAKVAKITASILVDFLNLTQKSGSSDPMLIDPKQFDEFAKVLQELSDQIDQMFLKDKRVYFVAPTNKLSPIDEARLKEALRCAGCGVLGKQLEESPYPTTNFSLLVILQYRANKLKDLCKYFRDVKKMDSNDQTGFGYNFQLLWVIAKSYS